MNRMAELLARGPVLFDGAMGTELLARGVAPGRCLEELNLAEPVLVSGLHRPGKRALDAAGHGHPAAEWKNEPSLILAGLFDLAAVKLDQLVDRILDAAAGDAVFAKLYRP